MIKMWGKIIKNSNLKFFNKYLNKQVANVLIFCLFFGLATNSGFALANEKRIANPGSGLIISRQEESASLVATESSVTTETSVTPTEQAIDYMHKKVKLKWDLKKGKKRYIKTRVGGIGKKKASVTMTAYSVKNAKKSGYKKLTATFKFMDEYNPTKKEVKKVLRYFNKHKVWHSSFYYAVCDVNSGLSLEKKNSHKVTCKEGKWKFKKKKIYASNGSYMSKLTATIKITVTYPKSYKGLCIGAGSENTIDEDITAETFFKGLDEFGESSLYKKGKTNSHWKKV